LVCGGRYDGIAPPVNSENLAGRIPGAELALFEGGHQFLWQDREAYARIISFLGGGDVAGDVGAGSGGRGAGLHRA
jgi:3-oxoadipate enol-lactonase